MDTRADTYFGNVADSYDRLQPILSPPYSKGLDMLVELIPFGPNDRFDFVDLGCGTAEPAIRVLEHFCNATGTCVDSDPEMLAIATPKVVPYSGRIELRHSDMVSFQVPACDVAFSAKAFHHVAPEDLQDLFARIADALSPGGCFILFDTMSLGPKWGTHAQAQASRFRQRHRQIAVASGLATQQEIDARMEFKRAMKAAGKDTEYEHSAEYMVDLMQKVGFAEVAIVWRIFSDTIIVAFTSAGGLGSFLQQRGLP